MSNHTTEPFDFPAFKSAFVGQDVAAWLDYFHRDAEWIEYKHNYPPRSPRRIVGREEIADFLARVKQSNVILEIEDEIVGATRAAFRVWCTLADGKRIIEHVIIEFSEGRISRQIDVEAWD